MCTCRCSDAVKVFAQSMLVQMSPIPEEQRQAVLSPNAEQVAEILDVDGILTG